MTYITANGKQGEILHGDIDYIAQRITTLAKTEQLKKELAKTVFGVMGRPSDWLIASVPSYEEVTRKLGVTFKDISLDEVKKEYDRAVMVGKALRKSPYCFLWPSCRRDQACNGRDYWIG